jgi:hypothetical protein
LLRRSTGPGSRWADLSLRAVQDKTDLMAAFAKACDFPATFGANWDALADALQDSACPGAEGCVLHLTDSGMTGLAEADRATLFEVLSETAAYWRTHGKAFVVLVDGAIHVREKEWVGEAGELWREKFGSSQRVTATAIYKALSEEWRDAECGAEIR